MERYYNGFNYHSFECKVYLSVTKDLKSQEKKLALTSIYCLDEETRLNDS